MSLTVTGCVDSSLSYMSCHLMLVTDPLMYVDPFAANNQKAVEIVGANLQHQYERWQPRARYKLSLDPTVDDVRKLCSSLRRNAKDERVLFHYNGHGVPRPTTNGEIWVFNKVNSITDLTLLFTLSEGSQFHITAVYLS